MDTYGKKIKRLEKQLDALWSEYIRLRDFMSCQRCHFSFRHDPQKLHGAHIIPKGRSKLLRWHPNNGIALCFNCHIFWQHKGGNEVEFARLCDKIIGKMKIDELLEYKKLNPTARFGLKDLEQKVSELAALVRTVEDR